MAIALPIHGSIISAGFSPALMALIPKRDAKEGILTKIGDHHAWNVAPSEITFLANTFTTPKSRFSKFCLLSQPSFSTYQMFQVDDYAHIHVDLNNHPHFIDQLLSIFFFFFFFFSDRRRLFCIVFFLKKQRVQNSSSFFSVYPF